MKKTLIILFTFTLITITAHSQNEWRDANDFNLANPSSVSFGQINDSTKVLRVGVALTLKGRQTLKSKGGIISCTVNTFFVGANNHLKTTSQRISLVQGNSNVATFEIISEESFKALKEMFLRKEDFIVICH